MIEFNFRAYSTDWFNFEIREFSGLWIGCGFSLGPAFRFCDANVSINSMGAHPPSLRAFVGHLSFWRKNVENAPLWGPNKTTKSPPLGTYIDANVTPLGDKI
jgi:hypothetical protein